MKKYYFIYKTTNIINEKFYIGAHGTNILKDGYIGSGVNLKLAIKKYGILNFKFEILEYYNSYDDLMKRERQIVDNKFLKNRQVYNSEVGGSGGKIWTDSLRKKMSMSQLGKTAWNKGLTKYTDERVKRSTEKSGISMRGKLAGEKNPMYRIDVSTLMTKEANKNRISKISMSNKGKIRTEIHKNNYRNYASTRFWIVNKSNELKHCLNENDNRLLTGEYVRGMKWRLSV